MDKIEKKLRSKNRNIGDGDLDQMMDDYIEDRDIGNDIEREEYDMTNMGTDFQDGNDYYETTENGEEIDWDE